MNNARLASACGAALLLLALQMPTSAVYNAIPSPQTGVGFDVDVSPRNATDYTAGYDPSIRNADGTLLASGSDPGLGSQVPGLTAGQFGVMKGQVRHHRAAGWSGGPSELVLMPGYGWFHAIDRNPGPGTLTLRPGSPTAFHPGGTESLVVSVTWDAAGCGSNGSFNVLAQSGSGLGASLVVEGQQQADHPGFSDGNGLRMDKLHVVVDLASPAPTSCPGATFTYDFEFRIVFETSKPGPKDLAMGTFQPEAANAMFQVYAGDLLADQKPIVLSVMYAPIVLIQFACNTATVTSTCADAAMRAASTGGPKNVVFQRPSGWVTLNMVVDSTGSVQGALTTVPDPYTGYETSRSKIAVRSPLGQYTERPMTMSTY